MSAELLRREFERVQEAPGSIPRLRRHVLDIAARGRLVPQDSSDGPATDLLASITAHNGAARSRGSSGPNRRGPVPHEEKPFAVPASWVWVRLDEVLTKLTDGTHHSPPNLAQGPYRYITAKNIKPSGILLDSITYVAADVHAEIYARCNPEPGDVLYVKDGATTGVVTINDLVEPFSMLSSVALLKLPPGLSNRLLVAFLRAPFFYDQMRGRMKGSALPRVTLSRMAPALIPLPPLAEQNRIVAKLDEVMALCDELEAAHTDREALRNKLREVSLRNLVAPDEAKDGARFFLRNSPRMLTRPEHVAGVRQAILNLAVRGRLVPRDGRDEPTSELLKACDDARAQVASKDRRANVEQQPMLAADLCWSVPNTWDWRGLADLVLFIDYRGKTPVKVESGVRLITAKNVRSGYLSLEPKEFVTRAEYDRWMTRGLPDVGDVLFTTEAPMGNAAVVRLTEPFALAQRVINFRPYGATTPEFLALQLAAPPFQRILAHTATGLTALGIKAAKLKRLPIAVPPLAEQRRIVAKVDELMALCDELEHSLRAEQTERGRLLGALLHDALAARTRHAGGADRRAVLSPSTR